MRRLDRYIATHVLSGVLLALFFVTGLVTFVDLVDELSGTGQGDYTRADALVYILLTLPRRAFEVFPPSALLGSLIGLGMLASSSELTVIRAAGISPARITLSVMKGGVVVMLAALIVGELIAPPAEQLANKRRAVAISDTLGFQTGYHYWVRDGSSFIRIKRVSADDRLAGIAIYEFDDKRQLQRATRAYEADYAGDKWNLTQVYQSVFDDDRILTQKLKSYDWHAVLKPELISVVTVKPERLSAAGLYRYLRYLDDNELSSSRYRIALWSKLLAPVATGVMIFLAIPLVFGGLRSTGIGQRILVGFLIGVVFLTVQKSSVQLGMIYNMTPIVCAASPSLIFFLIGLWLMRRVH